MLIESLESRTHFAMTTSLKDGVLTINGVNYADFMTISTDAKNKVISISDTTEKIEIFNKSFTSSKVKKIKVFLNKGNDTITCYGLQNKIPVIIDGGAGDDTIEGSWHGNSTLIGGAGKDQLYCGKAITTFETKGDGYTDAIEYRKGDVIHRDSKDKIRKTDL